MKAKFCFRPGVNTLIGENGSGKTNVMQALRLLLDETLERNAVYLRESDFCRELGPWRAQWIVVSADFSELDSSEGCQLLRHKTGHMNGTQTGTYTFFFRPKVAIRKKLYELSAAGHGDQLREYLSSITISEYEPVVTGRARGNFLDDQVYKTWAGDLVAGLFPNPDDDDQEILGVKMSPIYEEVACTFVRALRDVIAELRGYRGNPLLTLLRGMESNIKITDSQRIAKRVKELNDDISTLKEITKLSNGIESALQKAVGHTYGPGVSIASALPDSMEKLLQKLSVLVGDSATSDYRGELHEQSLGGANLIYLALKMLEYEAKLSSDRVAHFFLIEEPEAHIHTHIQKTLFSNLPSQKTQVIVSTHSTHISSASKIASVNVLAKKEDHAEVYQPSQGLTQETVNRLERYLDAVRSTLLFAKGVLLVEGDAELIMIPAMLRAVFGVSPDELGFSVVSMNSAFFEHVAVIFDDDRIQRHCAIVTDLDKSLVALPERSENDDNDQRHARAAEAVGKSRQQKLQTLATGNQWIQSFFANHTFEVDFMEAGNSHQVFRTLESIYQRPTDIAKSKTKLEADNLQVAGEECLRLANKLGKGWFALLLSEKLTSQTCIPEYILRAIAFACQPSVSDDALKRIGEFRIANQRPDSALAICFPEWPDLAQLESGDFLARFQQAAPDDDLTYFYQYLQGYRRR